MPSASIELKSLADKIGRRVETLVQEAVNDLIETVVIRTPVDTGFLRGSWYISLDAPDNTASEGISDPSGQTVIAEMSIKVSEAEPGQRIFVLNNADYAAVIEEGHSQQAPQGMVAVTVAEASEIIEATARRIAR